MINTGELIYWLTMPGINMKKEFTEVTDEEFQNILHTNVNAVFSLSREVVKIMDSKETAVLLISVPWLLCMVYQK